VADDSRAEVLVEWAERVVDAEDDRVDAEVDEELNERLAAVLADLAAVTLELRAGAPLPDDCMTRALRIWFGEELDRWADLIERNRT
jgi:hypothetical protein